ncbi:MAG: flavoprotein [Flavonifractor plautii]
MCCSLSRTGNTLAKLANGVTDTTVTMAAKATCATGAGGDLPRHQRRSGGLGQNIGVLLDKKNVYFVPFRQDDPARKPTSLVADFSLVPAAIDAALEGRQLQPVLLGPQEAD